MANRPLQFVLRLRKLKVKGKENKVDMQVAVPTGRKRVDFRSFCKAVSNNTTFSPEEVHAVLNMSIATARNFVANGDTVEFGDMGTLLPSFKSKAVPKDCQAHREARCPPYALEEVFRAERRELRTGGRQEERQRRDRAARELGPPPAPPEGRGGEASPQPPPKEGENEASPPTPLPRRGECGNYGRCGSS